MLGLTAERIKRNWTQQYVAGQIGVTKAAVCMYENGKRKPSYDALIRLEKLFGMPFRELFKPVDE